MANQKKLFLNVTPEDETLSMGYQIQKIKEGDKKPSYVEILDEAGVNMDRLREFLKETLKKNKES